MTDYNVLANGDLFPIQPGMEAASISYVEKVVEWNPITQNAAIFYQLQTKEKNNQKTWLVPDGCMDFVFCCSPTKSSATILGKKFKSRCIEMECGSTYFGVRPFSEHGLMINGISMKEIANDVIPFLEMFPDEDIVETITQAESFEQRISSFRTYIKKKINEQEAKIDLGHYCFLQICASKGTLKMEGLVEKSGYSDRYLRKKFEESFGIPPKKFGQIVMFQNSLNKLMKQKNSKLDIVFENGYYDQAHLNHQFKKLVNVPPSEFKNIICGIS